MAPSASAQQSITQKCCCSYFVPQSTDLGAQYLHVIFKAARSMYAGLWGRTLLSTCRVQDQHGLKRHQIPETCHAMPSHASVSYTQVKIAGWGQGNGRRILSYFMLDFADSGQFHLSRRRLVRDTEKSIMVLLTPIHCSKPIPHMEAMCFGYGTCKYLESVWVAAAP